MKLSFFATNAFFLASVSARGSGRGGRDSEQRLAGPGPQDGNIFGPHAGGLDWGDNSQQERRGEPDDGEPRGDGPRGDRSRDDGPEDSEQRVAGPSRQDGPGEPRGDGPDGGPPRGDEAPRSATCINQADFATGTFVITSPGEYRLCEDIAFNPNPPKEDISPAEAYEPIYGPDYDENIYGLGFFAGIAVAASGVTIYLDGYTLEQSKAHALMQRFYANIQLNNSPFIASAGPAQFIGDEPFIPVSDVRILGPGTLGRSSHHGIHGNENSNVEIRGVTFVDFEVAAVGLNRVDGLEIRDCRIPRNRHDVPVNGLFSAARFIRPYGQALVDLDFSMNLRGETVTAAEAYEALVQSINNVHNDVVFGDGEIDAQAHPEEFALYDNHYRVVDGPCFAFLVHGKGPAVGGQGNEWMNNSSMTSSDVLIENNGIRNIECWVREVPAVVVDGTVQNDARGSVFQWVDSVSHEGLAMSGSGTYQGNVVADMQIMVAKAIHEGILHNENELQTSVNTIHEDVVAWAESGTERWAPVEFRCNGDSMHHVAKGVIVFRLEDTKGLVVRNNSIRNVRNLSYDNYRPCESYHAGASAENPGETQIGNVRGISVAASRPFSDNWQSVIEGNHIRNLDTTRGSLVVGIDVQGSSRGIDILENSVHLQEGFGEDMFDRFVALRLRLNVVRETIQLGPNDFVQETQDDSTSRRGLREIDNNEPRQLEWELGGCPFARGKGLSPHRL